MRYAIREEVGAEKNGRQTELRKPVKDNKLKAKLIIRDVTSRSNIRTSAKFNLSKENRNKHDATFAGTCNSLSTRNHELIVCSASRNESHIKLMRLDHIF